MKKKLLMFVASALLLSQQAFAYDEPSYDDGEYPKITGEILTEYTVDNLVKSKDKVRSGDDKTDIALNVEADFKLHLSDNWSFNTAWQLRPVEKRCYEGEICSGSPTYRMGKNGTDDLYGRENFYLKR